MRATLGWLWFIVVQFLMLLATVIGWFALIPFCLAHAWEIKGKSIKDGRPIHSWKWPALNWLYGNPEDGVSGITARVWNSTGTAQQNYHPTNSPALNAYLWSAWRNSADNLKYVFAWSNGPYTEFRLLGRTFRVGWAMENGYKVPLL
jgi:hypothetical protein